MNGSNRRRPAAWNTVFALLLAASGALANVPPDPPVINEPAVDGQIVNPADVHMETGPFSDADPGDGHLCSDWEIWSVSPSERVWVTSCIGGVERVHSHLGDGVFENSHAGRSELFYDTDYLMRTRHRDDSGDPATEWSAWSERLFSTGPQTDVFPLELDDILDAPAPAWTDPTGSPLVLPGDPGARLRVEAAGGALLLELRGLDGASNQVINPAALDAHGPVRVTLSAGATALPLPDSDLTFVDDEGDTVTVYLPSVEVGAGATRYYWVSADGSSYNATAGQTQPSFASLARGAPVPWTVKQAGYVVEIAASGFQLPVNIAFVPNPGPDPNDPLYYVSELYGQIKVVQNDGDVSDYATGLLNFNPTGAFPGSGEQGLAGIAVDPNNGDLYAGMLYDAGGPHYPKVDRFTSNDGGRSAATQTTILDMAGETQGQSHQISNITFGPDGKLYVHMGDGFDASTAQNLNSFRGKILRLKRDGSPPVDNPFYNDTDGITSRDYIFAYGFRNPFGGVWREADGRHYEAENGPSRDRLCQVVAARNYLWDGSDGSMSNFAIYNWDPAHAPVNLAFIQPGTFGGSGFPAEKLDHLFISESGPTWGTGPQARGKRITEVVLNANGDLVSGPVDLVEYNGTGKATAVALAAGPDGLYFSDLYKDLDFNSPIDRGANVLRIRFVGNADFAADVTLGLPPLAVQFTDLSNVPDPTEWHWDFGDGATSDLPNPSHVYANDGVYDVQLRVTGSNGVRIAYKPGLIRVGDFPIVALIGATPSPGPAEQAFADHLSGVGYVVDYYDDEPGARPSAAAIAAASDVVVVSSTIFSGNIGGEFRDLPVPLIHWESALNRSDREPLAAGGATAANATQIDILDNQHPVTRNLPAGLTRVFAGGATMSLATGNVGPGVAVLASRAGAPGEYAVLAADAGAQLLGGHVAPARRVFLCLEDESWNAATPALERLVEQAVAWALGLPGAAESAAALPLAHNFNGLVHPGEAGAPDAPDGFRSISDRGFSLDGGGESLAGLLGATGIPYQFAAAPDVPDSVHLGNRDMVDNGNWAFDDDPDGDNVGVRPDWLPDPDQSGPQSSDLSGLGLALPTGSEVGVVYNVSNGGGAFDVRLTFADASSVVVPVHGPDWFGEQVANPPGPGVVSQSSLGIFAGTGGVDAANADAPLNLIEAVIGVDELLADGLGDFRGKMLAAIAFENRSNNNGYAIYAAGVRIPIVTCPGDVDDDGDTDLDDLLVLLSDFGNPGPAAPGDADGDGDADFDDLLVLLGGFGCE